MVDQNTIDCLASAIDSAELGYSMRQVRLVDGISTYTLTIDGLPTEEFTDNDDGGATDQVYARIREVKQRKQAAAVIAALSPPQDKLVRLVELTASYCHGSAEYWNDKDAIVLIEMALRMAPCTEAAGANLYKLRGASNPSPQPNVLTQPPLPESGESVEGGGNASA